jgi:hypothetical protein
MKLFYLFFSFVFFLFIGCSTTYKVADNNKSELYKDFNNSAYDAKVDITLNTDSSVTAPNGALIKNDSMLINYPDYYPSKIKKNFPLSEINQASYKNHWKSVPFGTVIGLIVGVSIGYMIESGKDPHGDVGIAPSIGFVSGTVLGTIVGLIVGWKYIYQFGP